MGTNLNILQSHGLDAAIMEGNLCHKGHLKDFLGAVQTIQSLSIDTFGQDVLHFCFIKNRVHSIFISQIREALELTGHCLMTGHWNENGKTSVTYHHRGCGQKG